MASYATINFNYRVAMNQAAQLEDLANQLKRIATQDVDSALSQVSGSWKGDSAHIFLDKGNKAKSDLVRSANQLQNTANAIRRAARTIRDAEIRAKQIAEMIARRR